MRILFALATSAILVSGCDALQKTAETTRLKEQLEQADLRLAVATSQLEAANTQVVSLRKSLDESTEQVSKLEEQVRRERTMADERVAAAQQRYTTALKTVSKLQGELDAIEAEKARIAAEEAERAKLVDPTGYWYGEVKAGSYASKKNYYGETLIKKNLLFAFVIEQDRKDAKKFSLSIFHVRSGLKIPGRPIEYNKGEEKGTGAFDLFDDNYLGIINLRSAAIPNVYFGGGKTVIRLVFENNKPPILTVTFIDGEVKDSNGDPVSFVMRRGKILSPKEGGWYEAVE